MTTPKLGRGRIAFEVFFQRVRKALDITSQQDLARLLRVNRSAITQAKQRDTVPEAWLAALAREYGLSPRWLATGEGVAKEQAPGLDADFCQVPKVRARLCAGGGSFEVDDVVEDYYAFRTVWLRRKGSPAHMVLMDVFGNSMEPVILEGDMALIDQGQKQIIAGAIYAVGVDDTVMLKRIEKRPGALVLRSDNADYSPLVLQGEEIDQVRIIGKLVWSCREYR